LRKVGWVAFVLISIMIILSACSSNTYQNLDVQKAHQFISDHSPQILDVRTQEEYAEGHIPHSQLLPLQEIEQWYPKLDPNEEYLIVCRSGRRSAEASEFLAGKGFAHVYNMSGGMNQWTFEVEK
jgi:rhodanese-related sulfurtransferase